MNAIVQFVLQHGYAMVFGVIFARQIGVPLPAPMFLLAAGSLAASGNLGLPGTVGLSILACVLADLVWYEAGRRGGDRVLHFIHSFTSDPDARDRKSKEAFRRHGPPLLVLAKFVPGMDAVMAPLAGTAGTSCIRFLAFDAAGASLYSCLYSGLGYLFSRDLDRAVAYVARVGAIVATFAVVGISIYVASKLVRWHFARQSLTASPLQLSGQCHNKKEM